MKRHRGLHICTGSQAAFKSSLTCSLAVRPQASSLASLNLSSSSCKVSIRILPSLHPGLSWVHVEHAAVKCFENYKTISTKDAWDNEGITNL